MSGVPSAAMRTAWLLAALALAGCVPVGGSEVDGAVIEDGVREGLEDQLGDGVSVECPDAVTSRKGEIVDCVADDGVDRLVVRVTFDDSEGHFRWELTTQRAG